MILQEVLKQATATAHDELEQLMFVQKIMDGTLSVTAYKKILLTNYIVHYCVEKQLFENPDQQLQQELDLQNRVKLPALQADLHEIGIETPQINCTGNLDLSAGNAAVLGAMYVLEGATLGGNVIVKRLKTNPNLQQFNLGFHYYQVYGSELVNRWKQFCKVLNTNVPDTAQQGSINSALHLFNYFTQAQNGNFIRKHTETNFNA